MKKGFGYIRCSTIGQAEEGFTLDNQKRTIQEYCQSRGIQLVHIFEDPGRSGRTVNRPEFQEMLAKVKEKGIECIVIYKIDRFARNIADFSRIRIELKDKGISLLSVVEGDLSSGSASSLTANIFASVAEWESDVNSQRTKDALLQKFINGWQPTPPPIGYYSVGSEHEQKTCEPDSYTAPIIKKMFELYSTGQYSMMTLQEWLQDKNIISKNGTIISFSRINNILNNPFYYGLIRWHGQEKIGKHTPLINKQLFDTCKYILEKHRHFLVRERKYDFLLRGFVYCTCGMRLVGDWHVIRSNKKKIGYYHCQKRYSQDCKQKYVELNNLEEQVENYIKEIEFTDEFIAQVQQQAKDFLSTGRQDTQGMRQALINQKTGLEAKRNKLEDLLIDGGFDKETYNRKHSEVVQQMNNLQAQIDEVEEESKLDMPLIEETLFLTKDIYKTYKSAPDPLKRHYLRFFYEGFTVDNKVIAEATPTPIFIALKAANMVKLRQVQLPSINPASSMSGIIKAFQNPVWAEQIRERLKQINTLTRVAAI